MIIIAEPFVSGIQGLFGVGGGTFLILFFVLIHAVANGFYGMELLFSLMGGRGKVVIRNFAIILISPLTYVFYNLLSSVAESRINSAIDHLGVKLLDS